MSIKKIEMYTVICDNCNKSADENTDYSCWNDSGYAEEVAQEANFIKENNKHYCNNCYEYDEDDNLIINLNHESTRAEKK